MTEILSPIAEFSSRMFDTKTWIFNSKSRNFNSKSRTTGSKSRKPDKKCRSFDSKSWLFVTVIMSEASKTKGSSKCKTQSGRKVPSTCTNGQSNALRGVIALSQFCALTCPNKNRHRDRHAPCVHDVFFRHGVICILFSENGIVRNFQ